jgi:hypothetical protein
VDERLKKLCEAHPDAAMHLVAAKAEADAKGVDWGKLLAALPQLLAIFADIFKK